MVMASITSATDPFYHRGLTTARFRDALARYVEASKPDPLAKDQMESLRLSWEQEQLGDDDRAPSGDEAYYCRSIRGTLTLSSEFVSVAIHVVCNCKILNCHEDDKRNNCTLSMNNESLNTKESTQNKSFQNEFYIRLTVGAKILPIGDCADSSARDEKKGRKERAARCKLQVGVAKRLHSDPLVRRLLGDENNNGSCPLPLCEALIQQNQMSGGRNLANNSSEELEERVNVHENSLEGVRNALFGHCEDNLDVLELLLSMPYMSRSPTLAKSAAAGGGRDGGSGEETLQHATTLSTLADRAYLRLLEDALFDACEKEGEDELLDDLILSDTIHDVDRTVVKGGDGAGRGRGQTGPSKRARQSDGHRR